jgi:hypothetical protein
MFAKCVLPLFLSFALIVPTANAIDDDPTSSDRPKLPRYFTVLDPTSSNVYDMKAEPVACVEQALKIMNERGWFLIAKYYPELGKFSDEREPRVNPQDPDDLRFIASFATEDPGRSPIPLISMIVSLSSAHVSGRLASLRRELLDATTLENYDAWSTTDLRNAIGKLTETQTDLQRVKYRAPKPNLSFKQSVELYAMTLALLPKETKWVESMQKAKAQGHTIPRLPDMEDLAHRLAHQLPVSIPEGATISLLLYRPGDIDQPVTKGEFEERADVVNITRSKATFALEEFPVYFTVDQAGWNPAWIQPKDEGHDTTLMARKYEYDWTRFDGPYLWYRRDQLNGSLVYKATVRFGQANIAIEGERFVSRRGEVKRTRRDPLYDPTKMTFLTPGTEPPLDPLAVDLPDLELVQPMPLHHRKTLEYFFYRTEGRQFLTYQISPSSSLSSLYPPSNLTESNSRINSADRMVNADVSGAKVTTSAAAPNKQ